MLTFLAVNIAAIMFRSESISTALVIYKGLLGLNGYSLGYMANIYTWLAGLKFTLLAVVSGFVILFFMPNTITVASFSTKKVLQKSAVTYTLTVVLIGLIYALLQVNFYESPFLYFQF